MSEHEPPPTPPEGFVAFDRRGPFTQYNGPFYHRPNSEVVEHGFFVLNRHCNSLGIAHGGMLASFIDGMLGHLSLDFLSMARAGEWVQGEARVTRRARDVAFAEARATVGSKDVVRATAIFKLMERLELR